MRLHVDDSLYELDTADLDGEREGVPSTQDVLFDGCHVLPGGCLCGVIDTARSSVSTLRSPMGALNHIAAPCSNLRELSRGGRNRSKHQPPTYA